MNHVTEGIKELENIDLKSDNALSQIEDIISNKFKKLPSFRIKLALNTFIVRARHLNDNLENYFSINDLSFNPDTSKIHIGRANYQNQQIFYAATNRITALTEIRFAHNLMNNDNAKFVISNWKILSPLELVVIVDYDSVQKCNAIGLLEVSDFIKKCGENYKENSEINEFLELYKYISRKFIEHIKPGEEYKYKITAAFSNFIYTKIPQCDGIVYQSVQFPEEFNVALRSNVIVEKKIKLDTAYQQQIKKVSENNFKERESLVSKKIDYDTYKIEWQ